MKVIALVGAKGCGKSTVAAHLCHRHEFVRLRFADPLKAMLRSLGLKEDQIDGPLKEVPDALLGGHAPRWAMQSLGTEWGRRLISQDLWVNAVRRQIMDSYLARPDIRIVIDDCRFPNEVALVRELGGEVWRIRRPEVEVTVGPVTRALVRWGLSSRVHPSELHWPEFAVDLDLTNEGRPEHVLRQASAALHRIQVKGVE